MKIDTEAFKHLRWKKILIWLIAFLISGFYITSALGWFAATYMMLSGILGKDATEFWRSLNIADHIIRIFQVLLITGASLFFIFLKRIAVKLFLISLLLSLFSTVFIAKWAITFLGGLPSLIILALVYSYAYWLNRRGFLH